MAETWLFFTVVLPLTEAARSLSTRFRPVAGIIQSWDVDRGWISERGWECPVIIDNMMNLELLFAATRLSGDSTFYKVAVSHVDRTMKEQYRPDGSCYHVVDYSMKDGSVRNRHTAQGYAHESAWSRGQAWGIYGLTLCYRETGDRKYLDQALKAVRFCSIIRIRLKTLCSIGIWMPRTFLTITGMLQLPLVSPPLCMRSVRWMCLNRKRIRRMPTGSWKVWLLRLTGLNWERMETSC